MAETKEKEQPKVDVSGILSKEGDDLAKAAAKKPAKKDGKDNKKPAKKKHKHTHIEHHYDADGNMTGHTIRHQGDAGGEVGYVAKDLDEVHDGLEQHLGEPNGDEEAVEQQQQPQPQMAGAQPAPQGV